MYGYESSSTLELHGLLLMARSMGALAECYPPAMFSQNAVD